MIGEYPCCEHCEFPEWMVHNYPCPRCQWRPVEVHAVDRDSLDP